MNRLAHWMMRLYPARWRVRYGDELDALLTDTGADARVVMDLLRGGIRMQLSTRSFLRLALILGFAGWLAGMGASFLSRPNTFEAQATLRVAPLISRPPSAELSNRLGVTLQQLGNEVLSRAFLSRIIDELHAQPAPDALARMRRDIRIDFLPGDSQIHVSFVYSGRETTQQVAHALANALSRLSAEDFRLDISDTSVIPVRLFRPHIYTTPIFGFFAGLICAAIIATIRGGSNRPPISLLPQSAGNAL